MSKIYKVFSEIIGWTIATAIVSASITVPIAVTIWAVKWILTMLGVI